MRSVGDILLCSCYELGHQPLGIASPLGFLRQAGYAPSVLDISVEPFDPERVSRASLVAISVPMHTALRLGLALVQRIRAVQPDVHICLFGHYAWLHAEELLADGVDSVIGGEAEERLVALAQALEVDPSATVDGVWRIGRRAEAVMEKLSFPAPNRADLAPLDRYARLVHRGEEHLVGTVEASRGCLHECLHCPITPVYRGRFFAVPGEVVQEDIDGLVAAGAAHITFADPDFLNGPTHGLRIVRDMRARHPELTFDFTAKVAHLLVHSNRLPEFAALGCLFIVSAFESFDDAVLEHLEKGHTRDDALRALALCREAGITVRPSLMPFTPWETLDGYLRLLDTIAAHGLVEAVDPVQYAIRLLVSQGSALLDRAGIGPHLTGESAGPFQLDWRHPDPRMDTLHREVSALVEASADAEPAAVFGQIRALARQVAGLPPDTPEPPIRFDPPPPRLTEAWFC